MGEGMIWLLVVAALSLVPLVAWVLLGRQAAAFQKQSSNDRAQFHAELFEASGLQQSAQARFEQVSAQMAAIQKTSEQLQEENTSLRVQVGELKAFIESQKQTQVQHDELLKKNLEQMAHKMKQESVKEHKTAWSEESLRIMQAMKELKETHQQLFHKGALAHQGLEILLKGLEGHMSAFSRQPKVKGQLGELQIENMLQSAGLQEGKDYEKEKGLSDGRRPDFVLYLPSGQSLVLDAKFRLAGYDELINAQDKDSQKRALKRMGEDFKSDVKALVERDYPSKISGAMSKTLMYIPNPGAYLTLCQYHGELVDQAFSQGVILIERTNIHMVLSVMRQLMVQVKQEQSLEKLQKRVQAVVDKAVGSLESFEELKEHLDKAQASYQTTRGRLFEGHGNLANLSRSLLKSGFATATDKSSKALDKYDPQGEGAGASLLAEPAFEQPPAPSALGQDSQPGELRF